MAEKRLRVDPRVLRIGNGQVSLSWKFWVALIGAGIIVLIGFANNPQNPWAGALVAVSSVIGVLVGVALQFHPVPPDNSPIAQGAIRGIGMIAQHTSDTSVVIGQVLESTREARTSMALVSVQASMTQIVSELQVSMVQWDSVAPGALSKFEEDRRRGSQLLRRMTEESENG